MSMETGAAAVAWRAPQAAGWACRVAVVAAAVALCALMVVPAGSRPPRGERRPLLPVSAPGPSAILHALSPGARAVISTTLGSASRSFAASRVPGGWNLRGGGLGARLTPRRAELQTGAGMLSFALVAVGHGDRLSAPGAMLLSAHGNHVRYDGGEVSQWYAAGPLGIEQGFTVAKRGPGSGRLTLALRLGGSLRAEALPSGVRFTTASGRLSATYGGLIATGASGRRLPASLELRGRRLLVRVDDRGARYPVRVDPLVQQGPMLTGAGEVTTGFPGEFGGSVGLSADGNTALIGGASDNGFAGAAWVFTRSNGVWTQQGPKLTGAGESGDGRFGQAVALSADGNTALIGADEDGTSLEGAAWVFTRSGGVWTQQGAKLTNGVTGQNSFLGTSVSLSGDGNIALLGGPATGNGVGAAWVFTRSGGVWTRGPELTGTGETGNGGLGDSVALSADGTTALVGGLNDNSDAGAVWMYARSGSAWSQQGPKLTGTGEQGAGTLGTSAALSADGNTAVVGGPADNGGAGAAWVFTRAASTWSQQGAKLTANDESGTPSNLGQSVALSSDGSTALVGGPNDTNANDLGAAWMFSRASGGWAQQGAKLTEGDGTGHSGVGSGVALSADGDTALVGGPGNNSSVGAAWVFAPAAPSCVNLSVDTPPGGGLITVSLSCSGPEGAALTYAVAGTPLHGSLGAISQGTGQVSYTPQTGYAGQDTFIYRGSDAWGISTNASVTVTVPPAATTSPGGPTTPGLPVTATMADVSCSPGAPAVGQTGTCTATVSNGGGNTLGAPTGTVAFTGTGGRFTSRASCVLSTGSAPTSCQVSFMLTAVGTSYITAAYLGDPAHSGSSALTSVASAPVAGKTAAVSVTKGVVSIREPGGHALVPVKGATTSVPLGSTIDARKGTITLSTAGDYSGAGARHRRVQMGSFSAGLFTVKQKLALAKDGHKPSRPPTTDLVLTSPASAVKAARCTRKGAPGKGIVRSLTGVAKGLYRTVGAASITTVTKGSWTVQDRCDGTLTKVIKGTATVTSVHGRARAVHLHAGQVYLSKARFLAAKLAGG